MTAPENQSIVAERSNVVAADAQFARRANRIAAQRTQDQLVARVEHRLTALRNYLRLSMDQIIAIGEDLEALRIKCPHGEYIPRLEKLGISRTSAQRYRDAARFAALLRAEPAFKTGMTFTEALALVESYRKALETPDDELDADVEKGGKPKRTRSQTPRRGSTERMFARLVQHVRENLHDPNIEEDVNDGIARLRRVLAQREPIEAAVEDFDETPDPIRLPKEEHDDQVDR